jgi:hypothetical protein
MRQHLAKLAPAFLVGGCSLIYNPSNIDRVPPDSRFMDMAEIPVDADIRADAMPGDLAITEAFPLTINEGAGTDGSRASIVVLRGMHFVASQSLNVVLDPPGAVSLDNFAVASNGDFIALTVSAPISAPCTETMSVPVDVTVSQNDFMGMPVSKTLDDAFSVRCLDELDAAPASANDLKSMYSRINIAGALDFPAGVAKAAILRSASSITIGGALDGSATLRQPGPGGGLGGGSTSPGAGLKPGGGAVNSNSGGGGGYVNVGGTPMNGGAGGGTTGDIWISSYATNASSGGGGGGNGVAGNGGDGGGGGGTIELTAPGPITVGNITANGGSGSNGTGGVAPGDGGAGTGGTVLIRGGAMVTTGTVSVTKGMPGTSGGASSDGRIRVDSAAGAYPTNATRGPMFQGVPTFTTNQMPTLNLRGTASDNSATLRVFDKMGNAVANMTYMPVFGISGAAQQIVTLKAGYNNICVWVAGGMPTVAESINCVEIAYLP